MAEVNAKIMDVRPLMPVKLIMETQTESGEKEMHETILFIDQVDESIYDNDGPVDEQFRTAVLRWIEIKQREVQRRMRSEMVRATPEQLAQAGIDLKGGPAPGSGKLIITGR